MASNVYYAEFSGSTFVIQAENEAVENAETTGAILQGIGDLIEHCRKHAPLPEPIHGEEVGSVACFLASPLAHGITGATIYVDKGYNVMGVPGIDD